MREQFDANNIPTRPVIRVVGLPENYLNRVDELRMRDRNDLVCLDVKINEVSQPYGWLKQATYECLDCGTPTVINQRRARERESPRVCRVCLDKVFSDMDTKDLPMGMFHPRPNFRMVIEECVYEDVQDISMSQITYNSEHLVQTDPAHPRTLTFPGPSPSRNSARSAPLSCTTSTANLPLSS